ncbi:MAG TPA: type II toxin-antitoxin system prevent-host-death family antitoxin [Acidobacteriaceae bacterium]|jgi:prevent-host-death family protein|nr:type II toxin-antitoxin system prevent-host-death family antitoxin [Acidobacteriaceae bacterium]
MHKATMHEAKTNLSALVERAQKGEEVIITSGRDREPVARVVAMNKEKSKGRAPGLFKGVFKIGRDFDKPLPADELRHWMGE